MTHASHPSSPKNSVDTWESLRTFPRPITHRRMANQSVRISGWNSIYASGPTTNRTIGRRTYQWQNLRITHGTTRQQRCPPFGYLWGTNLEPHGKSQDHPYPKSQHA